MSLNKKIILSIIIILLIVPGAYIFENISKERSLNSGTVIKVQDNSNLVSLMGTDMMKALMEQEFPGDEEAKGPTLLYVMGSAGVGEFKNVEIKGLDGGPSFRASRDEINADYILSLTSRGTVSLCKKDDWQHFLVVNVSEINKIN